MRELLGIELFDFRLGQDIESHDTKNGAKGKVKEKTVYIGSPSLLDEMNLEVDNADIAKLQKQGKTVVFEIVEGKLAGAFAISDKVREVSKEAVRKLKENGVKVYMLTGDAEEVAASVSEELGIKDYFAEVLPDQKAEKIKSLKEKGLKVPPPGRTLASICVTPSV